VHTLIADPLDQPVQHVDGGARVVERPVRRCGCRGEQSRQRGQSHARGLVAGEHPAGQPDRAQHRRPWPGDLGAFGGRAQEADVEAGVVGDEHRAAGELQKRGQHRIDSRRIAHHRRRDTRKSHDLRRDTAPGIDERGQLTQHRAAAHLDRPDLGDRVVALAAGPPSGGLEVDDDERGFPQ
jgi:hypothetical protein